MKTGYYGKGYYYDKVKKKYHVRVLRNGRRFHLGRFDTPEEAAAARLKYLRSLQPEKITV